MVAPSFAQNHQKPTHHARSSNTYPRYYDSFPGYGDHGNPGDNSGSMGGIGH
jgi:hypothetical protein